MLNDESINSHLTTKRPFPHQHSCTQNGRFHTKYLTTQNSRFPTNILTHKRPFSHQLSRTRNGRFPTNFLTRNGRLPTTLSHSKTAVSSPTLSQPKTAVSPPTFSHETAVYSLHLTPANGSHFWKANPIKDDVLYSKRGGCIPIKFKS